MLQFDAVVEYTKFLYYPKVYITLYHKKKKSCPTSLNSSNLVSRTQMMTIGEGFSSKSDLLLMDQFLCIFRRVAIRDWLPILKVALQYRRSSCDKNCIKIPNKKK